MNHNGLVHGFIGGIILAILVVKGTKYACNLSQDGDHICLQSRIFLKHLGSDRLGSKSYFKKFEIAGI